MCRTLFTISFISITANFIVHNSIRIALQHKYSGDSFHTLSTIAALGLSAITTCLLIFVLVLFWFNTKLWFKHGLCKSVLYKLMVFVVNLLTVATLYILMLVVVPQIFYAYYQFIFTGLPVQWVIKPLSSEVLLKLVSVGTGASMADHLAGFTFWVLVMNTILQWLGYSYAFKRSA